MCGNISCNKDFLCSRSGVLTVLELLCGGLCWALTAQFTFNSWVHQFVMSFSVIAWIFTLIFFIKYFLCQHDNQCSSCRWDKVQFVFNYFCWAFYFVGAAFSTLSTSNRGELIAATVFAYAAAAVYLRHFTVADGK